MRLIRFVFGHRLIMTHEIARMIGFGDFRRLMVAKGTELGMIESREVVERGYRQIVYVPVYASESSTAKE